MKPFVVIFIFLTVCGCYSMGPEEGAISTVPVTNNPNALPGAIKSSSVPGMF